MVKMWRSQVLRTIYFSRDGVSGLWSLLERLMCVIHHVVPHRGAAHICATGSGGECRSLRAVWWVSIGSVSFRGGFKKIQWKDWLNWPWSTLLHIRGNDKEGQREKSKSRWHEGRADHYWNTHKPTGRPQEMTILFLFGLMIMVMLVPMCLHCYTYSEPWIQ